MNFETYKSKENFINKYNKVMDNYQSIFNFHMLNIINEILKEIKPISIYLIGGFGRNEGSFFLSNNSVSPMRDYDILLIVNKHINNKIINNLIINTNNKLGFYNPSVKTYRFKGFIVWITQVTLKDINSLPFLKYYELKENSILLWGKNIKNKININANNLSPYNGIIILFSKIETILGLLNLKILIKNKMLNKNNNTEDIMDFIYECIKMYIESATCLNLIYKIYKPTFLKRSIFFANNFKKLFPDLYKINNNLGYLITKYAYKRLLFEKNFIDNIKLEKLINEAQNDIRVVIWYYITKTYNLSFKNEPTSIYIFDECIKKLNTIVLFDVLDYYIKLKYGYNCRILNELAIRIYLRYTLFLFFISGRKNGFKIRPSILFLKHSNIMITLWSLSYILLGCVKDDFQIDVDILKFVEKKFSRIISYDHNKNKSLKDPVFKFSYLQKNAVQLLGIADKIFHRKE